MKGPLAAALAGWLAVQSAWPAAAAGQTRESPNADPPIAVLQMRVLEGEGAVVAMGGKSSRGIVIQVTDETGRPVEGAAVSFHLPGEGPSGTFLSGLKTEVATTGPGGKVSVYGIQWNGVPGPVQVRVTAAKGEARAGVIVNLSISDKPVAEAAGRERGPGIGGSHKGRWILLVLLAGGAVGGAALGMSQSKSASPSGVPAPPAAVTLPPSIGTPTISVGRP